MCKQPGGDRCLKTLVLRTDNVQVAPHAVGVWCCFINRLGFGALGGVVSLGDVWIWGSAKAKDVSAS